jgi:hypothetical protein
MSATEPRWPVLTRALDDPGSPVRAAVDRLLDTDGLRSVRRDYRAGMGSFQAGSRGANAGTIGTAFDITLRFLIDPRPDLGDATAGAANLGAAPFAAARALIEHFGATLTRRAERVAGGAPIDKPLQVPQRDATELVRACWALALFTEVYRAGAVPPGSPLVSYLGGVAAPTVEDLLSLASDQAAVEMGALVDLARDNLLVPLAREPAPWFVGPIFTASKWMDADADLIAGSTLVEIKTNLGDKQKDGTRVPTLSIEALRQVLGYVLHDVDDTYRIGRLGLYDARYGTLTTWPLQQLLDQLAGRTVDLPAERAQHRALLFGGWPSRPRTASSKS